MLLVAIPALAAAASTAEVVATLVINSAQLDFVEHEGYDLVSIEGAVHTTEPAEPMLPVFYVQLLLPPGSSCSDIQTSLSGTVSIPGSFDLLPAPRPVRFSSHGEAELPQPSRRTYDPELPYPLEVARLVGEGSLGGYGIATVRVTPLQYVAATGQLILHTNIEIAVATESADEDGTRLLNGTVHGLVATSTVAQMVENNEEMSRYTGGIRTATRAGGIDYLVITPSDLADEFQPLADWKTLKGVRSEIVTLEDIAANPLYGGVDEAERIRSCIRTYRDVHGISWVLLGGDTNIVPARNAYDFFYDEGIPCDLYYADLDGTWNDDGDDRWGEIEEDGIDMYADVFVGRAPVGGPAEAATFVEKVLAYEGAPFQVWDDFQLKMLFFGEIMWDSPDPYTDGGVALDIIDVESIPVRFSPITKLYQRDGNLYVSAALNALNGGYGLVMHEGHSNITKASVGTGDLTTLDLDNLDNGQRGGLWYSVGCWSAAIDHDTFGEHWLVNPNGGGVAYVGNSRYGWGCPGYPGQCVSDLYSQEFFASLFTRDLVHAGVVHADAKHQFVGAAITDDYMRYAMYELNLLGDPEMPVWTDTPAVLTVVHPEVVETSDGVVTMAVEVAADGSPVEGAIVCVASADGSVYEVTATGAGGEGVVTFEPGNASNVTVTVTGKNCIPHGSSVDIEGSGTGIADGDEPARVTALQQNYPNPFN
ncbi:MAG: hypothetical protein KAW67_04180, partial [Candidatus Eisenbacteria sp.]|nr:hypothetical protein [Candidatus Eisenbacteria bacterium]